MFYDSVVSHMVATSYWDSTLHKNGRSRILSPVEPSPNLTNHTHPHSHISMSSPSNPTVETTYHEASAPDSTDSNVRYAAYASRLRTIAMASHRYVAYTSDVGESFRPVFPPVFVKLGYGVSWAYILGDVSYTSWVAKLRKEGRYRAGLKPWDEIPAADPKLLESGELANLPDWKMVGLERMIFQSVASMGLPAFTIHSTVKYSGNWFNKQFPKNAALRTWGPIALGLSVVPVLPYLFDKPMEHLLDQVFQNNSHEKQH